MPEIDNSLYQHTFTAEGVDSIQVAQNGEFMVHVRTVRDRSHSTETLAFCDGKLSFVPD